MKEQKMRINLESIKQDVIAYYLQGYSLPETATHFGIAEGSVSNILVKNGIPRRSRSEGNKLKWTLEERQRQSAALIGNSRVSGKKWEYDRILHKPWIKGEKNHKWKGGKTPLNLMIRGCPEYAQWRKATFERDKYTCTRCNDRCCEGNKVILNADHIIPLSLILHKYDIRTMEEALTCQAIWDTNNGRTLCISCHRLTDTYGLNTVHYEVLEKSAS